MSLRFVFPLLGGLIFALITSCDFPSSAPASRPHVFRSVLDQQPRMMNITLAPEMQLAFDTRSCQLYKLWRGGIHLDGAAFTNVKTVQPTSWGTEYAEKEKLAMQWWLAQGNQTIALQASYEGYTFRNNQLFIQLSLAGETIPAFPLEIGLTYESAGTEACLDWEIGLAEAIPGQLLWEQGGEMRHISVGKKREIRQCFAALPVQQPLARKLSGDKGALWLDRSGCTTCHEPYAMSVGPGYAQIAERYQEQENALLQLSQKVRQGGSGNWGNSMMPPHPQLDEGALKSMIRYMLRFQPSKAAETTSAPAPKVVDPEISAPIPNPGHGAALVGLHPSLTLAHIRPAYFQPRVGGMAFLPDSSLLVSTWDSVGAVYRLQNVGSGDTSQIRISRIAEGLAEPLGLEVVDGEIFVLQKQELTHLIDEDGDGTIDTYRTVCDDWGATADFHEFSYGLLWHEGSFWANLGLAMRLMSHEVQHPDRGQTIRISPEGQFEAVNSGLRQPNGIGLGPEGEVFISENQGRWVPACKIIHVQEGAFHGCRLGEVPADAEARYQPPAVWLPQDEIGNSPGELTTIPSGRYAGQLLHGEVTHGGLKRVFLEKVRGQFQGCVFRFTQGLEAGINRLTWGPDGALYVGGVGMNGNWGWQGNQYGLQRLNWNEQPAFEMLAVRLLPNGLEIELTEPIASDALTREDIQLEQWHYLATKRYGGPKLDLADLTASSLELSPDRRTIQLRIPGLQAGKVVYLRLPESLRSESGRSLWASEAWYTLNQLH